MEQIFPGLCEYRLLALEGKEPRLVVVFDETNVLRDGRLGDVESLGCLGENSCIYRLPETCRHGKSSIDIAPLFS